MTPGVISRVVKDYFKTGQINQDLLPIRERFFAEVNSITFKSVLLNKIYRLLQELESFDSTAYRVNLFDHL